MQSAIQIGLRQFFYAWRCAMFRLTLLILDLNSARWKLGEDLSQRRHDLFWRLFVSDTWIVSADLYIKELIKASHRSFLKTRVVIWVDQPVPQASVLTFRHLLNPVIMPMLLQIYVCFLGLFLVKIYLLSILVHSWNIHFTLLLSSISETALSPKGSNYSVLLDSDRRLRDFEILEQWRMPSDTASLSPDIAMYWWLALSAKETGKTLFTALQFVAYLKMYSAALINLHRGCFAQALQEAPTDLQQHRYLPSVVAIYRCSWRLIHGLIMTWTAIPKFLARVNIAWSHGLSAAVRPHIYRHTILLSG